MRVGNPKDSVSASRRRMVKAYDLWLQKKGRAERDAKQHSDRLFVEALRALVDLARDDAPSSLGVPGTRSGWANWRKGRGPDTAKMRLDVCQAILTLTDIDVTSNQSLIGEPVNATDMVWLGPVRAIAQGKGTDGPAITILVDWIDFKLSAHKDVTRDLIKPGYGAEEERIGSVQYALREASISIGGGDRLQRVLIRTPRSTDDSMAESLEICFDREGPLRWRAEPVDTRDFLKGSFNKLELASGEEHEGQPVDVFVSVAKADIEPIFKLAPSKSLAVTDENRLRQKLMDQILKNRIPNPGLRARFVLSRARAVKS